MNCDACGMGLAVTKFVDKAFCDRCSKLPTALLLNRTAYRQRLMQPVYGYEFCKEAERWRGCHNSVESALDAARDDAAEDAAETEIWIVQGQYVDMAALCASSIDALLEQVQCRLDDETCEEELEYMTDAARAKAELEEAVAQWAMKNLRLPWVTCEKPTDHSGSSLKTRAQIHQRGVELGLPVIPSLAESERGRTIALCGECGRDVRQIDHGCYRKNCPLGRQA